MAQADDAPVNTRQITLNLTDSGVEALQKALCYSIVNMRASNTLLDRETVGKLENILNAVKRQVN